MQQKLQPHTQYQNITPSYKMKAQRIIKREKKIHCKKMLSPTKTQMLKHKDERTRHTKMRETHTKMKDRHTKMRETNTQRWEM